MFNIYKISYQMNLLHTKEVGGSLNLESGWRRQENSQIWQKIYTHSKG